MSISSYDQATFSDDSIASPIRRPERQHDLSYGSADSLPTPAMSNGLTIRRVASLDIAELSTASSSMKTAQSYIFSDSNPSIGRAIEVYVHSPAQQEVTRISSGSSIFGSEDMPFTDLLDSPSSKTTSSISASGSGATIFSDAHETSDIAQDRDIGSNKTPYIRQSINLTRANVQVQGLVNTGPLLHSSMSSSLIHDSDNETSNDNIYNSAPKSPRGIGTSRTGSSVMQGSGAVSVTSSHYECSPKVRSNVRNDNNTASSKYEAEVRDSTTQPLGPVDANISSHQMNDLILSFDRPVTFTSSIRTSSLLNEGIENSHVVDERAERELGVTPRPYALVKKNQRSIPSSQIFGLESLRSSTSFPKVPPTHLNRASSTTTKNKKRTDHLRYSQIRRNRAVLRTTGYAHLIRSGLPSLPSFPPLRGPSHSPSPQKQSFKSEFSNIKADLESRYSKQYDKWGRPEAPTARTLFCLVACFIFPPLWLFLATGYFDETVGTIPRWGKIVSMVLTCLTLAAGTALVIVFSLVNISYA